jgi:hypothetical protein
MQSIQRSEAIINLQALLVKSYLAELCSRVPPDADLAINQKSSDNNEVRPRFSGRDNGVASSRSGRTYR